MRESEFQRDVVSSWEGKGASVFKMNPGPAGLPKGFPDLLVLMPAGRAIFVETKAFNGRVSPIQKYWHGVLTRLGFEVVVPRPRT